MDRATVYFDQTPLETDVLRTNQYAMVGLAKLSEAMLGTGIAVSGFPIAPTAPASLSLTLGAGQVYQQENLEASSWSSLPADTHTIVKQGILLDAVGLTFTPPTTPGYSQCFLIEVQYQDADTLPVVLPYYNAANPDVSLNGPGGNGAAQNTARKGAVAYQIKAGIAATSGTQVAPAPDAGWAGLYVVTLAYGATTVTAGNIAPYLGAPFIPVTLPGVPAGVQSGQWVYGVDAGTADAYAVTLNPATTTLTAGQEIFVKFGAANATTSPKITINGAQYPLLKLNGAVPSIGDVVAGWAKLFSDGLGNVRFSGLRTSDYAALIGQYAPTLVTNPVIYVRTDGSDQNNGLANTAAGAFATIQAAINFALARYYFPGGQVTIKLGVAGTYNGSISVAPSVGTINVVGDAANQANYIIAGSGPAGGTSALVVATTSTLNLIGVTVQNTGTNNASISARVGGAVNLQNVTLTGTNAANVYGSLWAVAGGNIGIQAGCIFSQSCASLFQIQGGIVTMFASITLLGTPAYTSATCACASGGSFSVASGGWTFSGAATGTRYLVSTNGIVSTGGAGQNFFPGSAAGSTSTGGQYV